MRIAIVDDDMEFTEKVETTVVNFCNEVGKDITVRRLPKGAALLKELAEKKNYDVYILDVEMPELDGLELARKIRETQGEANIVVLSGFEKYALPAYKVRACDYIMKENYKDEIPLILDRLRKERPERDEYYSIQTVYWVKRVRLDEILYMEKEKKYVVFYCTEGRTYRERTALEEVYRKLPHERFIYIHKGCIINMKHVTSLKKDVVGLNDDVKHVASRGMGLLLGICEITSQTRLPGYQALPLMTSAVMYHTIFTIAFTAIFFCGEFSDRTMGMSLFCGLPHCGIEFDGTINSTQS